jgi:hypothetical protein
MMNETTLGQSKAATGIAGADDILAGGFFARRCGRA